jgi:cbb3-type cytochrome oxidase maturation protein
VPILYVVVPVALLVALAAVLAFAWAVRSGQFDDVDTPALRILSDDGARDREAPL